MNASATQPASGVEQIRPTTTTAEQILFAIKKRFIVATAIFAVLFSTLGGHSFFYVRSGPETLELDMQKAYHHILAAGLKI